MAEGPNEMKPSKHLGTLGRFALALAIGAVGAVVFRYLHLPLPFMLGSLVFTMIAAVGGIHISSPKPVRPVFSAVIGAMLGTAFSAQLVADMPNWWLTLSALVAFSACAAIGSVGFFRYFAGYDAKTAYFAGMPGGLIEMVALAEEFGADVRRVMLAHSLRVLLIVFAIPWAVTILTGADLSVRPVGRPSISQMGPDFYFWFSVSIVVGMALVRVVYLPAGHIFGPMLVSALIHIFGWSDFVIPNELVVLAQVVMGTALGTRFFGSKPGEVLRIIPGIAGSVVILLAITAAFAAGLSAIGGIPAVTVLLSFSPGGFTEMGIIAFALGIDTAFVATHHLVRVALVSIFGTLIFRATAGGKTK